MTQAVSHKRQKMSQITVRGLPESLEREIRRRARRHGSSLSRTVIELLEGALGFRSPTPRKRDLTSLSGTWDAAALTEFQQSVAQFGEIDAEIWQR
jgi:plasmid stability protein